MGKRLEKLKRAKVKLHKAVEKGRGYRDKALKEYAKIQKKAGELQRDYPVFGGTEELFGFNQPQKAALKSPDLMGNVSGVGVIDFGLGDYAGRAAPVPRVDEAAIQKEMFEHPWADRATATRIAKDHKKRRKK